jgi:hypothetical protein
MIVHITSTPEYSKENIDFVVEVLNQVPGEMEFVAGEPLTARQLAIGNKKFKDAKGIKNLTFDEFYAAGETYRANNSTVSDNDFVVVLSLIPNDREWFSAFSGKNVFVDANGWEYLTDNDGKYGIAYQVVENIFQSLSGIDINDVDNEPNIHGRSIGCINDMNGLEKADVLLKLRVGFICPSCKKKATENGVDDNLLYQIQKIIQYIKDELMKDVLINPEVKPEKVEVLEKGKIKIGTKEIVIEALPNTLFIFFLENPDGIIVGTMSSRKDEVLEIYRKIKKSGEMEKIQKLCQSYDKKENENHFYNIKWDLNKTLVEQLGRRESEFYIITRAKDGKKTKYKVNLTPDYITINEKF